MHYNYPMSDQPMSVWGYNVWRRRYSTGLKPNVHTYNCYSDEGQVYTGTRVVFRAKVKE